MTEPEKDHTTCMSKAEFFERADGWIKDRRAERRHETEFVRNLLEAISSDHHSDLARLLSENTKLRQRIKELESPEE